MLRRLILAIFALSIASCKSYDLSGKKYVASNQEKRVSLEFINDTLVNVKQKFFCDKLPKEYQEITFDAKYEIDRMNIKTFDEDFKSKRFKSDILVLENLNCADCQGYKTIPNYEDLGCSTKIEDERLKDKVKSGVIYNLVNDTLILKRNQILFDNLKLKSQ